MKKVFKLLLCLSLALGVVSCANSPLGAMVNKHPSMDDVEKMVVGKTTQKEVDEKFSGNKESLMNGLRCYMYFKPSLIGEATKTTYLCFENGVLKQKYFM